MTQKQNKDKLEEYIKKIDRLTVQNEKLNKTLQETINEKDTEISELKDQIYYLNKNRQDYEGVLKDFYNAQKMYELEHTANISNLERMDRLEEIISRYEKILDAITINFEPIK